MPFKTYLPIHNQSEHIVMSYFHYFSNMCTNLYIVEYNWIEYIKKKLSVFEFNLFDFILIFSF